MRREANILDRKWAAIFAGAVGGLLLLSAALPVQAVSGGEPVAGASAAVTVPIFTEITLNGTGSINFQSVNPGTTNSPAVTPDGWPLRLNLTDNSNVNVNYTISGQTNATDGGSNSIGITNVSFNNNSSSQWATQLLFQQYTGEGNTSNASWSPLVNVKRPTIGEGTFRDIFFWIDVPAQQIAASYTGGVVNIRASRCTPGC